MIYSSDFEYLKRFNDNKLHKTKTELKLNENKSCWRMYCERSTIAETHNLVNPGSYRIERLIWMAIFIISIVYTVGTCSQFFQIFRDNLLETVLKDIQYPVYKIRFPAVTVCNSNRLNWDRIDVAKEKFLQKNRTKETEKLFEIFFATFESYRLGFFEKFYTQFDNVSLIELDNINVDQVLEFLSFRCEEMFTRRKCHWRNKKVDCCEAFEPQKTIFGHCFTFNSQITEKGVQKHLEDDINYPRRSPGEGPNSGIRFQVNLHLDKKRPGNNDRNGIQIIIHKPDIWPSGHGISFSSTAQAGTETSVALQPEVYTADKNIKKIDLEERDCIFDDESKIRFFEYLPGQPYDFGNCLLQCKLRYAQEVCGCIPDMTFSASNLTKRPCRASDFKCLGAYDRLFKQFNLKSFGKDMSNIEIHMSCRCAFTCAKVDFHGNRRYYYLNMSKSLLNMEIFFREKIMVRYQMIISFDWKDLLVAFGGIAGLFIGCSVISFIEIIYHFYVALKGCKKSRKISIKM